MKATVQHHIFRHDTSMPADYKDRTWCLCGRMDGHPVHQVPETDPDTTAAEHRRLGERSDD
jgi:hypothetical protein